MRYTITFKNLDPAAVNVLANAISARPWAEADPFMSEVMKQVQEQERAAALADAGTPAAATDAHGATDA